MLPWVKKIITIITIIIIIIIGTTRGSSFHQQQVLRLKTLQDEYFVCLRDTEKLESKLAKAMDSVEYIPFFHYIMFCQNTTGYVGIVMIIEMQPCRMVCGGRCIHLIIKFGDFNLLFSFLINLYC